MTFAHFPAKSDPTANPRRVCRGFRSLPSAHPAATSSHRSHNTQVLGTYIYVYNLKVYYTHTHTYT